MKGCQKFIYMLKIMIDEQDTNNVIGWNEKGDGFIIYDKHKLTDILHHYFRSGNFCSFHRQLNLYGFKQVRNIRLKDNTVCYKHRYFSRDDSDNLSKIKRCAEDSNQDDASTQTMGIMSQDLENNEGLRVGVLEREVESMRSEIIELRAGFNSLHAKLANQQNLFYAVFRTMNTSQNKSDVLFNVFLKQDVAAGSGTLNNTPSLTVNPDYSFRYNNNERRMLPLATEPQRQSHTQNIEDTYEVIANNFNNNPAFFQDCPIYVPLSEEHYPPKCESISSADSLLFRLINEADTELD